MKLCYYMASHELEFTEDEFDYQLPQSMHLPPSWEYKDLRRYWKCYMTGLEEKYQSLSKDGLRCLSLFLGKMMRSELWSNLDSLEGFEAFLQRVGINKLIDDILGPYLAENATQIEDIDDKEETDEIYPQEYAPWLSGNEEDAEHIENNCLEIIKSFILKVIFPLWKTARIAADQALKTIQELYKALCRAILHLSKNTHITLLDKWSIGMSAGGIPALSEQHGLSLLSAHLSTFDVFARFFFSCANTFEGGGGNHGLVPV